MSAYLDGELSGRDMQAFRAHLHLCPECAQILEIEKVTKEALASMPTIEPPAGFEERLFAHVMVEPVRKSRTWQLATVFTMTSVAACAITLAYLRSDNKEQSAPTVVNMYESQRDEAMMVGWDPYGGGSPVITPTKRQ